MLAMRLIVTLVACACACATGTAVEAPVEHDASSIHDAFSQEASTLDVAQQDDDASFGDVEQQDAAQDVDASANESSTCAASGTLVTYDFTGAPGNQTSTAATSTTSGITAGAVARASTITPVSGANSINGSGWSTSSLDSTRYYTLSISPPPSCTLSITSIDIDTKSSSTGPASASLATSADGFSTKTTVTTNASTSVAMSVTGVTSTLEVRVYGYAASGTAGTMRIENTLSVAGTLQ